MPLISNGVAVVTAALQTPVEVPSYLETVGGPAFFFVDADGVEWPMSNYSEEIGWFTRSGPSGWQSAPVGFTTDERHRGGARVRTVQQKSSTIFWPMEIFGKNYDEFRSRHAKITRAIKLSTRRQRPGRLIVRQPDGTGREALVWYQDGLGGESGQNHLYARPVVQFLCEAGVWRSMQELELPWTFAPDEEGIPGNSGFFSPFISLRSSRVVGAENPAVPVGEIDPDSSNGENDPLVTVENPGDCEAWPVWTITGPLEQLTARSETLQSGFTLTYSLAELQTITITTDPQSVRGPGDADLSEFINWFDPQGCELWPLRDGTNVISLVGTGYGPTTQIRMTFRPLYDGPG